MITITVDLPVEALMNIVGVLFIPEIAFIETIYLVPGFRFVNVASLTVLLPGTSFFRTISLLSLSKCSSYSSIHPKDGFQETWKLVDVTVFLLTSNCDGGRGSKIKETTHNIRFKMLLISSCSLLFARTSS